MVHYYLAVILTYLRGLEVSDLEAEDMPVMQKSPPEGRLQPPTNKRDFSLSYFINLPIEGLHQKSHH